MSSEYKSENEYLQAQIPKPVRKPRPLWEREKGVTWNPRWDKKAKHMRGLKRQGQL